jgi:hypothetical protein
MTCGRPKLVLARGTAWLARTCVRRSNRWLLLLRSGSDGCVAVGGLGGGGAGGAPQAKKTEEEEPQAPPPKEEEEEDPHNWDY